MSFVNKSKKAFKPKAPQARRNGASVSVASSIRGSQEPSASTPQPSTRGTTSPTLTASRPRISSPEQQRLPSDDRPGRSAAEQVIPTPAPTQESRAQEISPHPAGPERSKGGRGEADGDRPRKRIRIGSQLDSTSAATLPLTPQSVQPTPAPTQDGEAAAARSSNRPAGADDAPEQGANALLQLSQDRRRSGVGRDTPGGKGSGDEAANNEGATGTTGQGEVIEEPARKTRARGKAKQKETPTDRNSEQAATSRRSSRRKQAPEDGEVASTTHVDGSALAPIQAPDELAEEQTTVAEPETNREGDRENDVDNDSGRERSTRSRQKTSRAKEAASKRKKAKVTAAERRAEAIVNAATNPKTKKAGRKRKASTRESGSAAANAEEPGSGAEVGVSGKVKSRRKRIRSATPEDGERIAVDPESQTLGGLPSLKIGRLGPREQKLRERDAKQAAERKEQREAAARAELEEFMGLEGDELENAKEEKAEREVREKTEAAEKEERERVWRIEDEGQWSFKPSGRWGRHKKEEDEAGEKQGDANANAERDENGENPDDEPEEYEDVFHSSMPAFRVVDGKIVADPNARTLDAPALAAVIEQSEQTDIDRRVTEASFRYREPKGRWNADKLDLFYEGLQRWGTDFGMVATWVPGMSRNQVKRKYTQEERANPERITEALRKDRRIPTTLDEIREKRGRPLSDPKEWQADMDRREQEMRDKARADKAAADELRRNRGRSKDKPTQEAAGGDGADAEHGEDDEQASPPPAPPAPAKKGRTRGRGRAVETELAAEGANFGIF